MRQLVDELDALDERVQQVPAVSPTDLDTKPTQLILPSVCSMSASNTVTAIVPDQKIEIKTCAT